MPPKIWAKYFSGNYYVKFGHFLGKNHVKFRNFVNFSGKYHKNSGILLFFSGKNYGNGRSADCDCLIYSDYHIIIIVPTVDTVIMQPTQSTRK